MKTLCSKIVVLFCALHILQANDIDKRTQKSALKAYFDSLSQSEKIAQIFLINIEGNKTYTAPEKASDIVFLSQTDVRKDAPLIPGGVIFFSYNIAETPAEIISYIQNIGAYCKKNHILRPYLALDQEGGEVNRLRSITSPLPSNKTVAANIAPQDAYTLYKIQGEQLRALGFDVNLAPVSEAVAAQNEAFLGTRSYGSEPFAVSYSLAAVQGYKAAGIHTVLKHFPGNTNTDPHTGLPEIDLSQEALTHTVLEPFFFLLHTSSPAALLMSHARTASFSPGIPACLSSQWVDGVVKNQFGYDGLIVSDDIFMAALQKNGFLPQDAAIMALTAGVHVIMLSEKRFAAVASFLLEKAQEDDVFAKKLEDAALAVLNFKQNLHLIRIK